MTTCPPQPQDIEFRSEICKIDDALGLVLGWGIVCKSAGQDYYDTQADLMDEAGLLEAAVDFAEAGRLLMEMHDDRLGKRGEAVFLWPMTSDVAAAFGIETQQTGLMVGVRPDPKTLAKFRSGELRGFSIRGKAIDYEWTE